MDKGEIEDTPEYTKKYSLMSNEKGILPYLLRSSGVFLYEQHYPLCPGVLDYRCYPFLLGLDYPLTLHGKSGIYCKKAKEIGVEMAGVKQINGFTCFLACIESFFTDKGKPRIQSAMIEELRGKQLCNDNGFVPFEKLNEACSALGIRFSNIPYHFPIDKIYEDGSLLIGTTIGGFHCMRFLRQEEPCKIVVMDPSQGTPFWIMDKSYLESKGPVYHKIELI